MSSIRGCQTLLLFFALTVLLAACSGPQSTESGAGAGTEDAVAPDVTATPDPFPHQSTTLANGLQIITMQDNSAPLVAVHLWYHVGAKDEAPDRRGFAHLFEHMMFRGTPRLEPAQHMDLIRETGGASNAFTGFDETVYVQEVPSNQLELVMWLESERMGFLRFDDEGFVTERNVVAEEYWKTAEQPYGTILEPLLPAVFGDGAYSWSPIGDMDELQAATLEETRAFWLKWYVPNNATLVVVGDIEHDAVIAMAERYFGWIPSQPLPETRRAAAPVAGGGLIELQADNGPAPIMGIAWRTVPAGHPDEPALELLGAILGGGESSRLYKRLVIEEEAAMVAVGGAWSLEVAGVFGAGAVLSPIGGDEEATFAMLREEVAKLRTEGVTEAELDKARTNALRTAVSGQQTAESKAMFLGRAAVIYGDSELANDYFDNIRNVTRDDLSRVANTWLVPQNELAIAVRPSILGFLTSQVTATPDKPAAETPEEGPKTWGKPNLKRPDDLPDTPPIAGPLTKGVDFAVETRVLSNGLKVVVILNHEIPFVSTSLNFDAGAWADPADKPGVAYMTASLLTRGSGDLDYSGFADALASRAINLGAGADLNELVVGGSCVQDQTDEMFRLMGQVIKSPTLSAEQLELIREQLATSREIEESSPDYLASRELRQRLWGDHPYSREAEPTTQQLKAITAADLAAWWSAVARPDAGTLYVAGDVDVDVLVETLERHLGDWTGQASLPAKPTTPTMANAPTRVFIIDRPAEQTQIRMGQTAITKHDERWAEATVMAQIFGGSSLGSRLNTRIRGDEGLTYGAYGGYRAGQFGGAFQISTFSRSTTAVETVKIILEELERMRTEPVSLDEITKVQRYMAGSYILGRETPEAIASDLRTIEMEGLPADFHDAFLGRAAAATPADLQRVAQETLRPEALTIVMVGPAATLEPALQELGLPVTVIPVETEVPAETEAPAEVPIEE